MMSRCNRRGEGKLGIGIVLVVCVFLYFLANTPEGKRLFQKAVRSTQAPVYVWLSPYAIETGYYVRVSNLGSKTLFTVKVDFMDAQGACCELFIGAISAGETKTLDPSQINWRVGPSQTIGVSAEGFIKKVLDTNELIQFAVR